ncbi:hypothetical protein E9993_17910 [Labilibacter sediminis]|nr:hypothetical protein E9993_17910 [Labilibacter sediminis]
MKKKIQTTAWMLSVILVLLLSSCEKKDDDKLIDDNILIGTWVDTVNALPNGYYINELIFDSNTSFSEKSSAYGIYNGQDYNELSGWFVRTGNYGLVENKIEFTAKKVVSWDSFFGGDPVTTNETRVIFENSTFSINNDILELNYITYPADAPENTKRQYVKLTDNVINN